MATPEPTHQGAGEVAAAAVRAFSGWLAAPFDGLRIAHAAAVQAGFAPRSMLASRDVEHALVALERMALGPMARTV